MEQLAIKTGGILSILLGVAHCYYYRGFGWKKEFSEISILNSRIFYTIHIFLIPFFFIYGYLSLAYSSELTGGSSLGITLTIFYCLFWLMRTCWQVIYFRPATFNTSKRLLLLHYFFIAYFLALFIAYLIPVLQLY
jgi:hypothetical protein